VINHDFNTHQYNNKKFFSLKQLNNIIKNLENHSAPVQDRIHNMMLKNMTQEFFLILLSSINSTINKNLLPTIWKSPIITMIPKKAPISCDPNDYRPISLTSILVKIAKLSKLLSIKYGTKVCLN